MKANGWTRVSGVKMSLDGSLIKLAAKGDRDAQRLVYESLKEGFIVLFYGSLARQTPTT